MICVTGVKISGAEHLLLEVNLAFHIHLTFY